MKILCNIVLIFISMISFGQADVYDRSPEFIQEFGIKRIIQMQYLAYHREQGLKPDSTRLEEFNEAGVGVYSAGYLENERYSWSNITLDEKNRVIRNEGVNREGVQNVAEYEYLPNGDYILRYTYISSTDSRPIQSYKYFFDERGNEIRRQEIWYDTLAGSEDIKTYNEYNKILSRVYQNNDGVELVRTDYHYRKDTLLIRKDFFNRGELSSRTKFEYYPDGKEKEMHHAKENSWYSYYNEDGMLVKQMIVKHATKDTSFNYFEYSNHGLVSKVRYESKDRKQRREVYTYQDGKEATKKLYTRGDTFNTFFETVYLGDTAVVIYQTPYWKNRAAFVQYKRIDAHGNVLEDAQAPINGKKQPLDRWMIDVEPKRYGYRLSETRKVLEKYNIHKGWEAEGNLCPTYKDDVIHDLVGRRKLKRKYASCDTIRTRRHNDGKHYVVSMNCCPNLKRHIYTNKSGEADSILDVNKAGTVINRMIKENGIRYTYALTNRYEYNEMDSIVRVYECSGTRTYSLSENKKEEHVWDGKQKVSEIKFINNWGSYSRDDTTTVTYEYKDDFVYRTTNDRLGKTTIHRLKYDANNQLIQLTELDRRSNGSLHIEYSYDEEGNLLKRFEVFKMQPIETLYRYEFWE